MSTGLTLSEEQAMVREQFEERAVVYLADTYGDEPFTMLDGVDGFATELGIDPEELLHRPSRVEARRAIKAVMYERPNGYPRYLWIGGGYQRTEAVAPEILANLRRRAQATASGFIRRDQWLAELEAAKTGETMDDLVAERRNVLEDLEASLATS